MSPCAGVRLLSLDCTGTLFTWSASIGTLYNRGFKRGAKHVEIPCATSIDERFDNAFADVWRQWPLYGRAKGISSFDWWRAVARRALEGTDLARDDDAFETGFLEVYRLFQTREAYTTYGDTVPFLQWAKSVPGLQVCVVSNVTESYRDSVLPALGLDPYVNFGVYSKIEGVQKPDPSIFQLAATRAGVKVDEVLHIGNDLQKDALGALGAGCQALFLDRSGGWDQARTPASPSVQVVRSLSDARAWMEARGSAGGLRT